MRAATIYHGMSDRSTETSYIIEMEDITKRFGRVMALDSADFRVRSNEVMALVGDNGSGKSTLIKTLVGIHKADAGTVRIRGEQVTISSPKEARQYGIATVYQDLALVDELSVGANMFLARYPKRSIGGFFSIIDRDEMHERAGEILRERMNIDIDPTTQVEFLSGGERQAIAIARALVTDPDIVVMDEPTSALSVDSSQRVLELIRNLRSEGLTVVVITHSMDEVFDIADRITVIDNGRTVGEVQTDEVTKQDVVEMMVTGHHLDEEAPPVN